MRFRYTFAIATLLLAPATGATAEVFVYDEHDGRSGGTVGWAEDWPFYTRVGGELAQTAGYPRRRFNASLGGDHSTLWIAVTSRMSAPITHYSYHVPMGTTGWSNAYQHPGLHFSDGVDTGFIDENNTVTTGLSATTKQTWLARYEFGPQLPGGRFNILVTVWIGAGTGAEIDVSSPPRYTVWLQDTTLDSFYAGQDINGYTHFVERESVASSPREALGLRRDLAIVGHQDDDLLFMNPDLSTSIQSGLPVRTIYVTDGAAGESDDFRAKREIGVMAAYAHMAGVGNIWSCSDLAAAGKLVKLCTLTDQVSLIFLRIPASGTVFSFPVHGPSDIDNELEKLWFVPGYTLIDTYQGALYTRTDLIDVLSSLITTYAPTDLFTLDATTVHGGDHEEHFYAALFAHAARYAYSEPHAFRIYRGYNIYNAPINLTNEEFDAKLTTFRWYAACDRYICSDLYCGERIGCAFTEPEEYIDGSHRQYLVDAREPRSYRFMSQSIFARCLTWSAFSPLLTVTPCGQTPMQRWTLTEDHHLRDNLGRCAELGPNGVDLRMVSCSSAASQRFTVFEDGIVLNASGACMQLAGGSASATVVDATAPNCSGAAAQRWTATPY